MVIEKLVEKILDRNFFSFRWACKFHAEWRLSVADKTSGKQTPVSSEMQKKYDDAAVERGYKEILEFKSGDVYTSTVTAVGREPAIHDGKYSLSGKDLNMNIPLVSNEKTVITIQTLDKETMVWDMVFMGKLTELIYTRVQ